MRQKQRCVALKKRKPSSLKTEKPHWHPVALKDIPNAQEMVPCALQLLLRLKRQIALQTSLFPGLRGGSLLGRGVTLGFPLN